MGNIVADEQGRAIVERTYDTFSLTAEPSVMGRAVIVHGKADEGTQPTGDAGARLACGVIQPS
jgi:Cu-Zn family superoxide dismutase